MDRIIIPNPINTPTNKTIMTNKALIRDVIKQKILRKKTVINILPIRQYFKSDSNKCVMLVN